MYIFLCMSYIHLLSLCKILPPVDAQPVAGEGKASHWLQLAAEHLAGTSLSRSRTFCPLLPCLTLLVSRLAPLLL
jgi:hypothetical protein